MDNTPPPSPSPCPDAYKRCKRCQNCRPKMFFKGAYCRHCAPVVGRALRLLKNFGLTSQEYDYLMEYQGGVCAICKLAPKNSRFHVDHNHKTGLIRGILCMWCNHKLLAGARESIEILESALTYLREPPARKLFGVRFVPLKETKKPHAGIPLTKG